MAHERLSQADEPGHALGPDRATLYTFSPSHYNLRAVWALDRAGIVPRKVRMLPMLHVPIMASAFVWRGIKPRDGDRTSSPFGTPQLVVASASAPAKLLSSGSDIVAFADAGEEHRVFPPRAPLSRAEADAEADFVRMCHDELGVYVRSWMYTHLAYDVRAWWAAFLPNAGPVSGAIFVLLTPLLMLAMRSVMKVTRQIETRRKTEAKMRTIFAAVSERLAAPGGGGGSVSGGASRLFLFGNAFGPADLDFAALGAFAAGLGEEAFRGGAKIPPLSFFPPDMRDFMAEMKSTRAGLHIAAMLRDYRQPRA